MNLAISYSQNTKKVEYGVLFNIEEITDERMKKSYTNMVIK